MYADIAYQAFVRLLMMAFYGSVMIIVVAMARVLLKGAPRWICCMMWAFVAFRLLCPLDLPFGFSVYNIAEHTAAGSFIETISGSYSYAPANIINESSEKYSIGPADENDSNIKAVQNIEDTRKTAETANGAANADTADTPYKAGNPASSAYYPETSDKQQNNENMIYNNIKYFIVIWLAGMLAMFGYMAVVSRRLRRTLTASVAADNAYINEVTGDAGASLRARRARGRLAVFICDDIDSPFVAGLLRPRIYLPSGMDCETAACVMAHESTHIKRGDNIWKALGCALRAVYWFDPFVWLAYELFSRDVEIACDERVVRDVDREGRVRYSQALLDCSMPRRQMAVCLTAFGEAAVKERVIRVMNYKKPAVWAVVCACAVCVALALFFMTGPAATPGKASGGEGKGDIINAEVDPDVRALAEKANSSVQLTEEQVVAVLETNGFTLKKTEKPDFLKGNGTVIINGYEKEYDRAPICYSINYPGLEERVMLLYVYDAYYKARDIDVHWHTDEKTFTTSPISGKNIALELACPDGVGDDVNDGCSDRGMYMRIFEALCMDAFNGSAASYSGESENWFGSMDLYSYETSDGIYTYGRNLGAIKVNYRNGDIQKSRVKEYSVEPGGLECAFEQKNGKAEPEFRAYEDGYYICTVASDRDEYYNVRFSYDDDSSETLTVSRVKAPDKVAELTESIKYANGRIYFTMPESFADWNIRIRGRVDNGVSGDNSGGELIRYLNDESISGDWIRGKTYSFDVSGGGYTELFIEAGADGVWPQYTDLMEILPTELRGYPVRKLLNLNGSLYAFTYETQIMGDSGVIAGQITSTVKEGETPKENAQSNFGCIGNSFTRDDGDGQIAVFMDDEEYHVFKKI